eukprot:4870327-Pyramimonas_sp.AAC.1
MLAQVFLGLAAAVFRAAVAVASRGSVSAHLSPPSAACRLHKLMGPAWARRPWAKSVTDEVARLTKPHYSLQGLKSQGTLAAQQGDDGTRQESGPWRGASSRRRRPLRLHF